MLLLDLDHGDAMAEPLTSRELAVVEALRSMRTTDAIAAELGVSHNTLKTHVKAIYRKLHATSRGEAVRRAVVLRLVGPATSTAELTGSALEGPHRDDLEPELAGREEEPLEGLRIVHPSAQGEG
jgi:DNA-binding CsgD family transcriptional regulator